MDFEDFLEPEVGVAAAVVAVVASPQVRKVVRRGAVLGLAGALMAGDAITSFARGISRGATQAANGAAPRKDNASDGSSDANTVDATSVTEEPADAQTEGAQI
ncbi:MAG TPA: hypothetical protein VFX31_15685 [Ktedonobacterales bacterium]|nr:hypothetical protein [Ktedonobacterales bacterium]